MTQNQLSRNNKIRKSIIKFLSLIGLIACIAILFPQVRLMIMDFGQQIFHKEAFSYQSWISALLSYAIGGICFILFFDYCTLTNSGRAIVIKMKKEIKDCLSEINFHSFLKPVLIMTGVYLLGILTIIRANFSYMDDLKRAAEGFRGWYNWSRYISEFSSIFVHGDTNLTDISPLPQLLAILLLAISSVLLVYVIGNKKITIVRLLASIPIGLSPFVLECLSFKYDAPYMMLSVLVCIIPFLFIYYKKAFLFFSVISLLIMCMTYQAASGIYPIIVIIICFQNWNSRKKTNKEILSFLGTAAFAFCFSMLIFRFFLMKPSAEIYISTAIHPFQQIFSGSLKNILDYIIVVNSDLGIIWKIGIALVLIFFISKSIYGSIQKKLLSFFISIIVIGISFILSYGIYSLLAIPLFSPRALLGFGAFLAVLCIYTVSDYKKIAIVAVLALNWCFFVFAFSYGNALADQARYAEFRKGILLHDLSALYPDRNREDMKFQLRNAIDFAPTVKNIAKQYPVIEKLVPKRVGESWWDAYYFLEYSYYSYRKENNIFYNDFDKSYLNFPVVLDSYYHTIQSDGNYVLITLKH